MVQDGDGTVVETDDAETDDGCRQQIALDRTVGSMLTAKTILTSTLGALIVGSIRRANTCSVAGNKVIIREATVVGDPRTLTVTVIIAAHHIAQT